MKNSKRLQEARGKIEASKQYSVPEAVELIKETSRVKFDATVELHVRLNIDSKKSEQTVRASVALPHGTGKSIRIAAFVSDDQAEKARAAGAHVAGGDELIESIKQSGKCDFDIAVATPDMMKKMAVIARVLGQKGLMPNPKTGTIAPDVAKLIQELKKGKVSYKNDASGNVHIACGKISFGSDALIENIETALESLRHAKPDTLKGAFIRSAYLASSMGPSVRLSAA